MKNRFGKTPELLAPAGTIDCALAAYDAGADAVYAGLKKFNARERTGNFTENELARLIDYAHRNGRKLYVACNTLVKESELEEAAAMLADLAVMRPDALIVQDVGLLAMARDRFPGFTIHASTQAGFHNSAGLAIARRMGVARVILERQVLLSELERMTASAPPVELEVFIHGALCCCISGTCLLSSWLGGWSGNRGKCKQPCRRRYRGKDGNGFFLSAQDLCAMELLPRILRTGVASLKIEGRLRRADYVANAVSAYRMLLDAKDEDAFQELLPVARERMSHTYGRKWSFGYLTQESARTLVKFDSLGASGLLCGKVVARTEHGFLAEMSKRIHAGDVVRIQPRSGDEGPLLSLSRLMVGGVPTSRVLRGETCEIPCDKPIESGSLIYKVGEPVKSYAARAASLPEPKERVDLTIRVQKGVIEMTAAGAVFRKELALAPASRHPLDAEAFRKEFADRSAGSLQIGRVRAEIEGDWFLPASVMKSLRKEFFACLERDGRSGVLQEQTRKCLADVIRDIRSMRHAPESPASLESAIVPRGRKVPPGCAVVRPMEDDPSPREELLLPFFVPETELERVRAALDSFVKRGGRTVRITSLHHLELLRAHPGLIAKTCLPLPVCNSFAAAELKRLGVRMTQAWIELERRELELFAKRSPLPTEQYCFGRPTLLATRAAIPAEGEIMDARGNVFLLKKSGCLTLLSARKLMSIPKLPAFDGHLIDLRDAPPKATETGVFNFDYELK